MTRQYAMGGRAALTAADNIAVGRIEARHDRARFEQAAERSLADGVIEMLPMKYDQIIGKRFRTGVDLLGGEWQKVAIAPPWRTLCGAVRAAGRRLSLSVRQASHEYHSCTAFTRRANQSLRKDDSCRPFPSKLAA